MAWDRLSPVASSALVSSPVRTNFQELDLSNFGNLMPDPYHKIWHEGNAFAPADWFLAGTGASVERDSGNSLAGGMSVKLTMGSADATLTATILSSQPPTELKGKSFAIGVAIKTSTANLAFVRIRDGVNTTESAFHTGGGGWEWITLVHPMNSAATSLRIDYVLDIGASSGLANFDLPTLVIGAIPPQRFIPPTGQVGVFRASISGTISTGTDVFRFQHGLPWIVKSVQLKCNVAPTGADIIIDVNQFSSGGFSTMYGTRPSIAAGKLSGGGSVPNGVYTKACFESFISEGSADFKLLSIDIDQVGSSVAGSDLEIYIYYYQFPGPLSFLENLS